MIPLLDRRPGGCRYTAWGSALGLLLVSAAGCSRAFYRHQADEEVYRLIDSASEDPRWPLEGFTIQPSPESRMFDPFCPDYSPMPPDDPASHRLMHCVDCKPGWPCWRCYGKTPYVENPDWKTYLPYNEKDELLLDRQAVVELALLHSREYQSELEDLYLSALDVTFERFRLDAQFFGGNSTFFTADGPGRGGGQRSELRTDTNLQMRKLFASGGDLVVGMANSLVWQFAGPDGYRANTLLDFTLVQPLLRAGGRAVVLESLTDSERALLANIRQMERFRRGFYTQVVAGRSPGPGPVPGGVGFDGISSGGPRSAGGFLGLLEQQIQIRNQRANVAGLRNSLALLEALYEAGRIQGYQVDQARQSLLDGQSVLLSLNASYETQLDAFKITLGLPPELALRIEDSLLSRFDLIDPALTATQEATAQLLGRLRNPEEADRIDQKHDYLDALNSIRRDVAAQLEAVEQDFQALLNALPTRGKHLKQLSARGEFQRGDVDPRVVDVGFLQNRVVQVGRELKGFEYATELAGQLKARLPELDEKEDPRGIAEKLRTTLSELEPFEQAAAAPGAEAGPPDEQLADLVARLSSELLQLSLVQARTRLDTVTLTPVDLTSEAALKTARENRRDWMNARAALVDVWRQIELAANDLESSLDLTFSGDINTTDNNPVRFRGTTGRLRVGLAFDAPLTRLAERNTYRTALIAYQQARRQYYAIEDRIGQSLRETIRTIRLNQLDFEVQRAAVLVAIARVDEVRLRLEQPPRPGEPTRLGDTVVRDLVTALTSLLRAENTFLDIWVGQEVQRLNLDLDLGTMQLDACGMWIDPGPIGTKDATEPATEGQQGKQTAPPEQAPLPEDALR